MSIGNVSSSLPENTTLGSSSKQPLFTITTEFYYQFTFIVNLILTPIICVFGLVGNIVGIFVLGKDANNRRLTIYTYLLYLMTFDIMYLVLGLSETATEALMFFNRYLGNFVLEHFAQWRSYVDSVLNHMSSLLLIFMSTERLWALLSPFTVRNTVLSRYPRTMITTGLVVVSIYLLPFVISVHVISFPNSENRTEYDSVPKSDYFIPFDQFLFVEAIVLHYIAPATVLLLNGVIAIAYSRYLKQRAACLRSNQCDDPTKITVVVLCVATMYVLLSLPNLFIKTLLFLDDDYSFYGQFSIIFFLFINISDLMARINAACDFFIYILVSKRYRQVFSTLLCKCDVTKTIGCNCCNRRSTTGRSTASPTVSATPSTSIKDINHG